MLPVMQAAKPMDRKLAVGFALAGYWLLSTAGVYWEFRPRPVTLESLIIIPPGHSHDGWVVARILAFYIQWSGAQITAAFTAGVVLSLSDFVRPLRVTFLTMAAYHLVFFAISLVRWPWLKIPDLDQWVPALCELIARLHLIAWSMFAVWFWKKGLKYYRAKKNDDGGTPAVTPAGPHRG